MNVSSIKFQLNLQFAVLALLAIAVASFLFSRQLQHLDDVVQEVALGHQVEDIVAALSLADDRSLQLDLPPDLKRLYEQEHSGSIFLIRNAAGGVLFADGDNALEILGPGLTFPKVFDFFQAADMSPEEARGLDPQRFGLTERISTAAGDVFVTVAQHRVADDFLSLAVAKELVDDVLIVGAPFVVIFLIAAFGVVRYSTRGLASLSEKAQSIGPQSIRTRLPVHMAPAEVMPLAVAFNDAMDRVADGYDYQQRFTIDAAHQLKTPLAVFRARLETLPSFVGREQLERDMDHMDHLVRQLLTSARVAAVTLDPNETFDICALATEVVMALAPIAIDHGKSVELDDKAGGSLIVMGEAHMAMEALRNIVDNAISHTASGTTVTVRVKGPATIEVLDRGPGVPVSDRKHVLMPFGQGRTPTPGGSGMGLAIASQIMQLHGGTVTINDREEGGAAFTLEFSPVPKT